MIVQTMKMYITEKRNSKYVHILYFSLICPSYEIDMIYQYRYNFFSFFKDAYGFSNKQVAMYFNSVSEGMKVFGLDNHEVHLLFM